MPELRALIAETRTGRVAFELPHTSLSWNSKVNDDGTASLTLPIENALEALYEQDEDRPGAALRAVLSGGWRYSPVIAYGGQALWAGPLLPARSDSSGAATAELRAAEIGKLFDKRRLVRRGGAAAATDVSRDLVFTDTNARRLAYDLVAFATTGTGYELPLTCDDIPPSGGQLATTYLAYERTKTRAALADIAAGPDGPDVRFEPYLYAGADGEYLGWNLRVGTPYFDGTEEWVWDDQAVTVNFSSDVVGMCSVLDVVGGGQDRAKSIVSLTDPTLVGLGFPVLEEELMANDLVLPDDLTALGAAKLAALTPTETWKLKVHDLGVQLLDGLPRVGDRGRLDVTTSRLLDQGSYRQRIATIEGSSDMTLTVGLDITDAGTMIGA